MGNKVTKLQLQPLQEVKTIPSGFIVLENGIAVNKKLNEGFVNYHNAPDYYKFRPVEQDNVNKQSKFVWHDDDYNVESGTLA